MKNRSVSKKTLVCFNCRFQTTLKHEAAALIIIRNHNERRGFGDRHILRTLDKEELKPVDSLPFYDGFVYRAFCVCGEIFARKTERGIEYAMAQHELFNYEPRENPINHSFYDLETYTETIIYPHSGNKREVEHEKKVYKMQKMKRSEYKARTKNPDVKFQESMAEYNLTPENLNTEITAITTYDPNIFWEDNTTHSFNYMNSHIWMHVRCYNCPACGDRVWNYHGDDHPNKQFTTFKELYWHYYREHYLKGHNFDHIERIKSDIKLYEDIKSDSGFPYSLTPDQRENWFSLKRLLTALINSDENGLNYRDTIISMLQQLVMVELTIHTSFRKGLKTQRFAHNRGSNALYQLNRNHGISLDDLRLLFFPESSGRNTLGNKLFHGMVWTENKAPDWLDKVVIDMGEQLGI